MIGKEETSQAKILIRGKVQGVFFRTSLALAARERSVTGWVKNLDDGSVEALLVGDKKDVLNLVAWAGQGPPSARVDEVLVDWSASSYKGDDFKVI